jgi:hypothetical protein
MIGIKSNHSMNGSSDVIACSKLLVKAQIELPVVIAVDAGRMAKSSSIEGR